MRLGQFFRKFGADLEEARSLEVKAIYGEIEAYFQVSTPEGEPRKFSAYIKLRVPGKGVLVLWDHTASTLRELLKEARKGAREVEKMAEHQKRVDGLRALPTDVKF